MKAKVWKYIAGGAAILGVLAIIGSASGSVTNNNTDSNKTAVPASSNGSGKVPSVKTELQESQKAPETVVTEETITKRSDIPFQTVTRNDNSLTAGTTKVAQEGKVGTKEEIYKVIYTDGVETDRRLVSSRTVVEPQTKIVLNGTYVAPATTCQNGTYVNSNGQQVCRPSAQNTGGATAICRDGTYSYSQSRRGTCSHHGGVRTWL